MNRRYGRHGKRHARGLVNELAAMRDEALSYLFWLAAVIFAALGPLILAGEGIVVAASISDLNALNSAPACSVANEPDCLTWTRTMIVSARGHSGGRSGSYCDLVLADSAPQRLVEDCDGLSAGNAVDLATYRGGHPQIRDPANGRLHRTSGHPQSQIYASLGGFVVGVLLTLAFTLTVVWSIFARLRPAKRRMAKR